MFGATWSKVALFHGGPRRRTSFYGRRDNGATHCATNLHCAYAARCSSPQDVRSKAVVSSGVEGKRFCDSTAACAVFAGGVVGLATPACHRVLATVCRTTVVEGSAGNPPAPGPSRLLPPKLRPPPALSHLGCPVDRYDRIRGRAQAANADLCRPTTEPVAVSTAVACCLRHVAQRILQCQRGSECCALSPNHEGLMCNTYHGSNVSCLVPSVCAARYNGSLDARQTRGVSPAPDATDMAS